MTPPVSGGVPEQGLRKELRRLDRQIRGALATLDNKVCKHCRALTAVGEPCEEHVAPFDALNRLSEIAERAALERPRPALPAVDEILALAERVPSISTSVERGDFTLRMLLRIVAGTLGGWLAENRIPVAASSSATTASGATAHAGAALPAEHAPPDYLPQFVPSEKAKMAGIEAAEKAANTPGWGLDGIPKAMIDAMCVAAIRAAYRTDRPNWGELPGAALPPQTGNPPPEPSETAIEAAREASAHTGELGMADHQLSRRTTIGMLRAAYAVDRGPRPALAGSPVTEQEILAVAKSEGYDEGETWWPEFAYDLARYLSGRVSGTPEGTMKP